MEQITQKELSAYFPHGLKVQTKLRESTQSGKPMNRTIGELHGLYSNYGSDISVIFKGNIPNHDILDLEIKDIKPIVYDISWITKPITHEGETFVPIEWFEIGDDENDSLEYDNGNIKLIRSLESLSTNGIVNDISYLPFAVVEKLISWRFDVFSLIPRGLAEPVTETFNPYLK